MRDAYLREKGVQLLIFATLITLECNNLSIKRSVNKGLKLIEFLNYLILEFE
jgi:hypothetical protein